MEKITKLKIVRVIAWFMTGLCVGLSATGIALAITIDIKFLLPGFIGALVFLQWNGIASLCTQLIDDITKGSSGGS